MTLENKLFFAVGRYTFMGSLALWGALAGEALTARVLALVGIVLAFLPKEMFPGKALETKLNAMIMIQSVLIISIFFN